MADVMLLQSASKVPTITPEQAQVEKGSPDKTNDKESKSSGTKAETSDPEVYFTAASKHSETECSSSSATDGSLAYFSASPGP